MWVANIYMRLKSESLEDGETGKLVFKFELRATGTDSVVRYRPTLRTRFSVGARVFTDATNAYWV